VDGSNGQVLATDGNGTVYWGSISAGATNLDGLSDVEITSPQPGQILNYSVPLGGTVPVWRNITSPYAPIASPTFTGTPAAPTAPTATNTTQIATTAFVKAQGYLSSSSSINDLGDVTISTVATGQILQWSGTQWVNATLSTVEYVSKVQHLVKCGVAVTKGQAVYVTSADGTNMIVGLASNASEATSSKVIGLAVSTGAINDQIFVVTEGGFAKRTAVEQYRIQNRGGIGIKVAKLEEKRGDIVGALIVEEDDEVLIVLASGKVVRSAVSEVPARGRDTMGVVFARFDDEDSVLGLAKNSERNLESIETGAVETVVEEQGE
ncbi:MAG: hypothetical protein EBU12_02865, partial [Microbacteriaceae bacterium]|nr:hypothetical protein [Microbacteriaceae bacterium]